MAVTLSDPIADMLTRIRNGLAVNKAEVSMPHSKAKEAIAKLLKQYGFILGYQVSREGFAQLVITLSDDVTNSRLNHLKRVSKPGQRVYVKATEIPTLMRGRGLSIVSTSKGVMAGHEARKQNLGGEYICEVW
jgi:small subunit ribosomal protein S8